jgi:hypothetical protein
VEVSAAPLNAGHMSFENLFDNATAILQGGFRHQNVARSHQINRADVSHLADLQLGQTGLIIAARHGLGARPEHVGMGDAHGMTSVLQTLEGLEQSISHLDEAPGRLFEARFNNALESDATLGTKLAAIIGGHQAVRCCAGSSGFSRIPRQPCRRGRHRCQRRGQLL